MAVGGVDKGNKIAPKVVSQRKQMIVAMLYLLTYLSTGAIFYVVVEEWTFIDSIYFAVVTMSTVGYGDLDATTTGSKVFTVFFIAVGVLVVFAPASKVIASFQAQAERRIKELAEQRHRRIFQQHMKRNPAGKDTGGFFEVASLTLEDRVEIVPPAHVYYVRGLVIWVLAFVALTLASAGVFTALEPGWGYGNAIYHCWVTATTVGYGWNGLETDPSQAAKAWAAIYILLSTTLLATTVGRISNLRATRAWQKRRNELLNKQLDADLIESLDTDGNGVDKLEFVVGMLTKLNLVQWTDIDPFLKQFEEMDTDKSGRLTAADLKHHGEKVRAMMQGGQQMQTSSTTDSLGVRPELLNVRTSSSPTSSPGRTRFKKQSSCVITSSTFREQAARIHPRRDCERTPRGEVPLAFCTPVMTFSSTNDGGT